MKNIDVWTRGAVLNNCEGVYCNNNTVVRVAKCGAVSVELFGNKIFYRNKNGTVFFTLAGWNTQTTRARLNALLSYFADMSIHNVNKRAVLDGATFTNKPLENKAWYRVIELRAVQVERYIE